MPKIFISYRRSDAAWTARSLYDRLAAQYGAHSVFMDIDNIPFGIDFRTHIDQAIRNCNVVLAVIGPNWLGTVNGKKRIEETTDPIRVEIETAFQQRVLIIPVLVDGSVMPGPTDLPDTIRDLSCLNAASLEAGRDFHSQIDRL